MSIVAETSGNAIVCPFVAELAVDSTLNVQSKTTEKVTITHIDNAFDVSGTRNLAAAFDCSGWGINNHLGLSSELVSELVVSLRSNNLRDILQAEIDDGRLNTYLRGEFNGAFSQVFPAYANTDLSGDHDNAESDAHTTNSHATGGAITDASSNANLSASMVVQTASITSYSFVLDISGGEAAQAMVDGLTESGGNTQGTSRLNTLFLQLPFSNIQAAVDASGDPLSTIGKNLPLKENDTITFVFDIHIEASTNPSSSQAANTYGNGVGTDGPGAAITNAGESIDRSIVMDLGSRRVAYTFKQGTLVAYE